MTVVSVARLHRRLGPRAELAPRLRRAAEALVGRPYIEGPLVGGVRTPEQLVVELGAFDCVTFIETVLALARSRSSEGFVEELIETRYRNGRVDWKHRNHYFIDWLRRNERRGAVKVRTRGAGSRVVEATLSLLPGLKPRRVRFHVVPKHKLRLAITRIADGSIVAFASLRRGIDFFHTGMVFYRPPAERRVEGLMLYSARKSAGKVVVEPLTAFLKKNRMRGVAIAGPLAPGTWR